MRQQYASHIFDCDGVILDSTLPKAQAFFRAAVECGYSSEQATALMEYHKRAGAIGREARINWFFSNLLGRSPREGEFETLYECVSERVAESVQLAPLVPGIENYLRSIPGKKAVVSGVETDELVRVLDQHAMLRYFDGLIFGTSNKAEELQRLFDLEVLPLPAVYYGDEEGDRNAARDAGIDFALVYGHSQWHTWRQPGIQHVLRDFTAAWRGEI